MCLPVCLFVCLFVYLFVHVFIRLSVRMDERKNGTEGIDEESEDPAANFREPSNDDSDLAERTSFRGQIPLRHLTDVSVGRSRTRCCAVRCGAFRFGTLFSFLFVQTNRNRSSDRNRGATTVRHKKETNYAPQQFTKKKQILGTIRRALKNCRKVRDIRSPRSGSPPTPR